MNIENDFDINEPEINELHNSLKNLQTPQSNLARQQRFKDELKRSLILQYNKKINIKHQSFGVNFFSKLFNHAFVTAALLPFLVLGSVSTYAYSSSSVYEGHILFPVKIVMEAVEFGMVKKPEDKAAKKIKLANRRLEEAKTAYNDNVPISTETLSSIADYTLSAYKDIEKIKSEEKRSEITFAIRDFSEKQIEVLSSIGSGPTSSALVDIYEKKKEKDPVALFAFVKKQKMMENMKIEDMEMESDSIEIGEVENELDDIVASSTFDDTSTSLVFDDTLEGSMSDKVFEGTVLNGEQFTEVAGEIIGNDEEKERIMEETENILKNTLNVEVDKDVIDRAIDVVESMISTNKPIEKEVKVMINDDTVTSSVFEDKDENEDENEDVNMMSRSLYRELPTIRQGISEEEEALSYIWSVSNKLKDIGSETTKVESEKKFFEGKVDRLAVSVDDNKSLYRPRLRFYPSLDDYEVEENVYLIQVRDGVSFYINEFFIDDLGLDVPYSIFREDVDIFMTNDNSNPFSSNTKQPYNKGYLLNINRDITLKFVVVTDKHVSPVYTVQVSIVRGEEGDEAEDEEVISSVISSEVEESFVD